MSIMPWPCVRPSVCLSQTCVLSKLLNGLSCFSVEAVFSQEIPISPKYGYIRRELCLKLWTWKISPRHADRRKFCQRSLQAAEAIGPGGLRPVHFWPLCAAAISDPPTCEPPFKHAMVQFYILQRLNFYWHRKWHGPSTRVYKYLFHALSSRTFSLHRKDRSWPLVSH